MNPVDYWPSYVTALALVLVRAGGLVVASPIFSSRTIPAPVKAAIALSLALVLFPPGSAIPSGLPRDVLPFASAALTEAIVGLVIGFASTLVFFAVQMAGQMIGLQIGLSLSQYFNPVSGAPSTTMETFYSLLASAIFLTMNAHHWLILGIDRTFDIVPLGGALAAGQIAGRIVQLSGELWVIALQIALPVFGTLLLTDVILGLLTRAVPQVNVFVIGVPFKLLVGFVLLIVTLPAFVGYLDGAFRAMTQAAQQVVVR